MHEWARELKEKTDKGAILAIDGELWIKPEWRISEVEITIRSGNCTHVLWERGDTPKASEKYWRKRLRVLVDA